MNKLNQLREDLEYLKENLSTIKSFFSQNSGKPLETILTFKKANRCGYFSRKRNEIVIGTKHLDINNMRYLRKKLLHEFIHAIGKSHNVLSRSQGFYSKFSRDTFTDKIIETLGWEKPTREDYKEFRRRSREKYFQSKKDKRERAKYKIYCPKEDCKFEAFRIRESKIVKYAYRYLCPRCKGSLESKAL
jgi:predicted SprT family Zn-dependent metalloprotease